MRFINKWSYACARYLTVQLSENHEKRRVYYYGFQIVIGAIVKGVLLITFALILRSLAASLVVMLVFSSLRMIAGGYHMDTYGKCIFVALILFISAAAIASHTYQYWTVNYIIALIVISFSIGLPAVIKWAPKDTPNKPITKPEEIRKFKLYSVVYIFVWTIIIVILLYFNFKMYVLAASFGLLLEIFTITPVGHKFFEMVSGKVDHRLKGLK